MTSGGRIPITGDDWMRNMERRVNALERRPGVTSLSASLGSGIGPMATRVVDWNSPDILLNGWYFSDELSVNGPDPDYAWLGHVIDTHPGHGIQVLYSHSMGEAKILTVKRQFHRHEGQHVPEYSGWQPEMLSGTVGLTFAAGSSSDIVHVNFEIPFPAPPKVVMTHNGGAGMTVGVGVPTATGFDATASYFTTITGTWGYSWIAVP